MTLFDWIWTGVFVTAMALVAYHHVGYPLLLKWYLKRDESPQQPVSMQADDSELPAITMVVPAYNEAQWIAEKIRNIAMLDYPKHKLFVEIYDDGSSDDTLSIAQQTIQEAICADTFFEVHGLSKNQGKVSVINHAMKRVSSDITVLSDVSAMVSIDALRIAAQHFTEQKVGVVNGRYTIYETGSEGEAHYWKYQSDIKYAESIMATAIGAHGAFYAFRTELFEPLPKRTINDDFVLPMNIVSQGFQAVYDNNVIATELEPTSISDDFARRLRISAGNMQQVLFLAKLFHPKFHGVAFAFFSGKGLRLLTPYLLMVALISSLQLLHIPLFAAAVAGQALLYSIGILCWLIPSVAKVKVLQLVHYLLLGHTANLIGGLRYLLQSRAQPHTTVKPLNAE